MMVFADIFFDVNSIDIQYINNNRFELLERFHKRTLEMFGYNRDHYIRFPNDSIQLLTPNRQLIFNEFNTAIHLYSNTAILQNRLNIC